MVRRSGSRVQKLTTQLATLRRRDPHQWYDPHHHSCLLPCLRSSPAPYPIMHLRVIPLIHTRPCRHHCLPAWPRFRPRRLSLLLRSLVDTRQSLRPPLLSPVAAFRRPPRMSRHPTWSCQRRSRMITRPTSVPCAWNGRQTACSIPADTCVCATTVPSACIRVPMRLVRYADSRSSISSRSSGLKL